MASTTYAPGSVIGSTWLNEVNTAVFTTLPSKISSTNPTLTNPTLITPTLGVATATTINKIVFTQPATGATLTIPNGATATVSGVNTGDQDLSGLPQLSSANTYTNTNTFNSTVAVNGAFSATSGNMAVMYNTSTTNGITFGVITLNTATASTHSITITAAATISFSGTPPANRDQTIYIRIINGGAFTTTFVGGTLYPGGVAPVLTTSGKDLLSAWYDPFLSVWVVGMVWKDYK